MAWFLIFYVLHVFVCKLHFVPFSMLRVVSGRKLDLVSILKGEVCGAKVNNSQYFLKQSGKLKIIYGNYYALPVFERIDLFFFI